MLKVKSTWKNRKKDYGQRVNINLISSGRKESIYYPYRNKFIKPTQLRSYCLLDLIRHQKNDILDNKLRFQVEGATAVDTLVVDYGNLAFHFHRPQSTVPYMLMP